MQYGLTTATPSNPLHFHIMQKAQGFRMGIFQSYLTASSHLRTDITLTMFFLLSLPSFIYILNGIRPLPLP